MNQKNIFSGIIFIFITFVFWSFYPQKKNEIDYSSQIKTILRQVGNELLLSNRDSTSLILPITKVNDQKYQISFEKKLDFEPTLLAEILKNNLKKYQISKNYSVEVLQCIDSQVAYSYQIYANKEKTIIPCAGRVLPLKCYQIQVQFLEEQQMSNNFLLYIIIPLLLIFIYWYSYKKKQKVILMQKTPQNNFSLGSFIFYPEQNKLVQKAREIALSKKECELLEIFIANVNCVVKREELTKRVWEDNGVIVGRSLDTYISKLRKKLQEDKTIKLTNVHGVGYKLEIKK